MLVSWCVVPLALQPISSSLGCRLAGFPQCRVGLLPTGVWQGRSPQPRNLRIGPQFALDVVSAGAEDDAGGSPGLELRQTFAQLRARAGEGHLFCGRYVNES